MKAKHVTIVELVKALDEINKKYGGNIYFNRYPEYTSRNILQFTLRVYSSKAPGHSRGYYRNPLLGDERTKRLSSACWHVHGDFFDALFVINPKAIIIARGNPITIDSGNWVDFNAGSQMYPQYASSKCDCYNNM